MVATPGERVAVRMFPWMPAGVQVTIRRSIRTPLRLPRQASGDLMFVLEARDASGTQLAGAAAEVNLAVRYADSTVSGVDEGALTVSRLDPATSQWQSAPKLVREPDSNYVAASVTAARDLRGLRAVTPDLSSCSHRRFDESPPSIDGTGQRARRRRDVSDSQVSSDTRGSRADVPGNFSDVLWPARRPKEP